MKQCAPFVLACLFNLIIQHEAGAQTFQETVAMLLTADKQSAKVKIEDENNCVARYTTGYDGLREQVIYFNKVKVSSISIWPHRGIYFIKITGDDPVEQEIYSSRVNFNKRAIIPMGGLPNISEAEKYMKAIRYLYEKFCVGQRG